jgi:hypothetical protein
MTQFSNSFSSLVWFWSGLVWSGLVLATGFSYIDCMDHIENTFSDVLLRRDVYRTIS